MKDKELIAYEHLIICQIQIELLEQLPPNLNKQNIKRLSNQLIKELSPIVEKHYDKLYSEDEEQSRQIGYELDKFCKQLTTIDIFEKVYISQALEAYRMDKDKSRKAIHEVIMESIL